MRAGVRRNKTLRWSTDLDCWEFLCGNCSDNHRQAWWPLTDEFWNRTAGMQRCRACWTVYNRNARLHRPLTPEQQRARQRRYYREARPVLLLKKRQHYAANREAILAARRAEYWAKKAA